MSVKENNKLVVYFGIEILVPHWVEYLAADEFGDVYGFSHLPKINNIISAWHLSPFLGRTIELMSILFEDERWEDSLVKLKGDGK
ncbi:hypothetical protein [Photorhabdus tasmaniensis]|nr:hypothetical protein [Photorhabdus tasmaniensis]